MTIELLAKMLKMDEEQDRNDLRACLVRLGEEVDRCLANLNDGQPYRGEIANRARHVAEAANRLDRNLDKQSLLARAARCEPTKGPEWTDEKCNHGLAQDCAACNDVGMDDEL